MNKIFRNLSLMLVAGALVASCADYNETDNFKADPDPSVVAPYKDLKPVKSYIDRSKYPNLSLGAQLKVADFNKQELAHAAAITNFDDVYFGTTLMSGAIVNARGVMNFLDMNDLLDHMDEIEGTVFGSPIFANANQADDWLNTLTSPIEIIVEYVEGKTVNYNEWPLGNYTGTINKGKASIVNYDNQHVLQIGIMSNVHIIEDFDYDPLAKYTITFWARSDKDVSFTMIFSDQQVASNNADGKWYLKKGNWTKFVVETQGAADATQGYLRIDNALQGTINIQKVEVGYYPDNHRPQTEQEKKDTINYAINAWCEGLMGIVKGRIKSFDLIDEPIDVNAELSNGMFDIKHSTEKIFWQDIVGSENYAPVVAEAARKAYQENEGDLGELKFFISETGLEDTKKLESLLYWMGIWDNKGAKIDGINAKLNLSYSEDPATQAANVASLKAMLDKLAQSGKLIRLSNFDIKYLDADGATVATSKITEAQRQLLANYYADVIKLYMEKIPNDKQAGMCKGNMLDTSEPVGLWTTDKETQDWVRTATYEAFCKALSGQ